MYAKKAPDFPLLNHSLQVLEIQSFKHFLEQEGENFIQQRYTNIERSVSDTGERRIQYLAGRWATKGAIASILGQDNMRLGSAHAARSHCWLEIEILRLPTGQPSVALFSQCREIATRLGIKRWFLSISHTSTYAVASVAVGK
ncbi:MAG: holo-[acyl-carrier-protein] synthase [Pleurocapsa sp. SU_5_0]|nr:holo-[acyl-carrier-protein] synthase [Pleurocapsa sp. SU_5_0]NJR45576.1 holo-[acyl-carrier-protein] synthase [Hyellaceae cyanobacterium CSU_1_1]